MLPFPIVVVETVAARACTAAGSGWHAFTRLCQAEVGSPWMPEFSLLGPPGARGPAGDAQLGGGAHRTVVLAILVLRAGQLVSRDTLVDALWPDDPPPGARQTVESYCRGCGVRLREAGLDSAVIESAPAGYRLVLERLPGRPRPLRGAGRRRARRTLALRRGRVPREALALWQGPALDGLADRPALRADAAALTQARVLALEAWAEAQLDLGHTAQVVARLQLETGRQPHRERLHELLILALYRSGSQAEALEHYAAVRRQLVEELGLEPGPALREMQQRILRQDATLNRCCRRAAEPARPERRRRRTRTWRPRPRSRSRRSPGRQCRAARRRR